MAYDANKPDAGDTISSSQAVLKDNFTAIKQLVDVNHVTFGLTNQGKHHTVSIPSIVITGGSIPIATAAAEWALYTDSVSGNLFLRIPSQGAGTVTGDINLTGGTFSTTGTCTLPCGLIMKWGTGSLGAGVTTSTVSFASAYTSACYNVQISPTTVPSGDVRDGFLAAASIGTTGFIASRKSAYNGTAVDFNWLAIGK